MIQYTALCLQRQYNIRWFCPHLNSLHQKEGKTCPGSPILTSKNAC
jgi:hypothetical protein